MELFIGCSSRDEIPSRYYNDCKEFLEELFISGNNLVFGACGKGLMGLTYNVALNNNSNVTGIYPEVYKSETAGLQYTGIATKTINERTDKMIEASDALIFLPGGIGTVYELFTAIESKRAGEHDKPIIIYNSHKFFDNMLLQLEKMYEEKFASKKDENYYYVCCNVKEALEYLSNYFDKKGKPRKR